MSLLDAVDLRTQLVGENRLELLMFRLQGKQLFAINVFKVQEVQQMPQLTLMPNRHPNIVGITHVRGQTIPVIDLSKAINMEPISCEDRAKCNIIVSEYNRSVQAFMVRSVDHIINLTWDKVAPPPQGAGRNHYLTAITKLDDDRLVEVIDVEKVLSEVQNCHMQISENVLNEELLQWAQGRRVYIVDDSQVGLNQVKSTVESMGLIAETATDGWQGWCHLESLAKQGVEVAEYYSLMVTDAEMPEMDGYRLTSQCRENPSLKGLYILLHTSMSGDFNNHMAKKVGCDAFISKFDPDALAQVIQERLLSLYEQEKT